MAIKIKKKKLGRDSQRYLFKTFAFTLLGLLPYIYSLLTMTSL